MSLMSSIVSGKVERPRRTFMYGVEGIGKSSLAASAEDTIFIQTEDGAGDIDVDKFPLCENYKVFKDQVLALMSEEHEYKHLAIDSVDWLEKLIEQDLVESWNSSEGQSIKSLSEIPYGKGSGMLEAEIFNVLNVLDCLVRERKMGIILIAHSEISRFEAPDVEAYDRYVPALNKKVSPIVREWADEVLFLNYKVSTVKVDDNFGKAKHKGIGGTQRLIYTTEKPAHMAKNRCGLPETMELAPNYWTISKQATKGAR